MQPVSITAIESLSASGHSDNAVWDVLYNSSHAFSKQKLGDQSFWAAPLSFSGATEVENLRNSDNKYKTLDPSVLFAIWTGRKVIEKAGWKAGQDIGINIGSSRGATQLFEKYYKDFLESGKTAPLASPTTTLGNISSWVANDLQSIGPEFSHSITCSTSLHAVLNGIAWLNSGMSDKFLVGGSEAPLTPFTIAQMQALKIYSNEEGEFPSRAMDFKKTRNSMILGEGAALCALEPGIKDNALAVISGVGYATEPLIHNTSISANAICFQKSMQMALSNTDSSSVDAIVLHAPGTIQGDASELEAIRVVFGDKVPLLTTGKWKTGHLFGASGMLSVEFAVRMMQDNRFMGVPFGEKQLQTRPLRKVLVNSVGFGGNAVTLLVEKI